MIDEIAIKKKKANRLWTKTEVKERDDDVTQQSC